jgi:hypothetical protein
MSAVFAHGECYMHVPVDCRNAKIGAQCVGWAQAGLCFCSAKKTIFTSYESQHLPGCALSKNGHRQLQGVLKIALQCGIVNCRVQEDGLAVQGPPLAEREVVPYLGCRA